VSQAKITISLDEPIGTINPNLYGHFAEHLGNLVYDGIWVGEDSPIPNAGGIRLDVVNALKRVKPPVVRWPGGCFADDYHWQDGIGPRAGRPKRVNIWWGRVIEPNWFGTHEFIRFCRLIGAEPYLCGNVGSGSPRELRDWVEYCNYDGPSTLAEQRAANGSPEPFGVRYWSVGNENWGCGGNFDPEDYAVEYKRFTTYMTVFGGTPLFYIGCGPHGQDVDWTRRFFAKLGRYKTIHGYSVHYYCGTAGNATEYTENQWYELIARGLEMEQVLQQHRAVIDGYDPERRIGLVMDEWGTWHPPTEGHNPSFLWQQNTLRDALVAASTLDIFNRLADKVVMGNIAQTINVLQALILTQGDKMITTPTYHIYDMYQEHQGGSSVRARFEAPEVSFGEGDKAGRIFGLDGSASVKDGVLTLSVVNPHISEAVEAQIALRGGAAKAAQGRVLAAADIHAHNSFEAPEVVAPVAAAVCATGSGWTQVFPPASVTVLRIAL
jgi:alpha-N-arabinofuranosidase